LNKLNLDKALLLHIFIDRSINYMKKLFLFFFVLWQFNAAFAQTNVYHPFPSDSAIWNVSYQDTWNYACREYSYSTAGDTIINSITYHKIQQQGQAFLMKKDYLDPFPTCTYQIIGNFNNYIGAIREDVAQKKVYIFRNTDSAEVLLYDFNLNVGDTIKGYFSEQYYDGIIVSAIDSTLIGAQYRKTWIIDPYCGWGTGDKRYSPQIIEGIGCTYGLLELPCIEENTRKHLTCFSHRNQTLYPTYDATSACTLLTSINEKEGIENILSIFPNPSSGKFQLTLSNSKSGTIEVMDVLGNKILRSEIKNETTEVDLSDHQSGIYFVRITDPKGNFAVKKIVKG
jgi:hypothetical protein